MPEIALPIAGGFYVDDSLVASSAECSNWNPITQDGPALTEENLRGRFGITQVADLGAGDFRGRYNLNGEPYFVISGTLYRLNANMTTTDISGATTISGSGPVSMAENGTQLMIVVPGSTGYIWDGTTFQEITDPDFLANGNPTTVVFIDSYFLCTTDQDKIITSAVNNGLAWDALDFEGVTSSPDGVVAAVVFRNQLFVGGDRTFETFSNIGGTGFPFQRVNLFLQQGLSGRFAVQTTANTFMWIGAAENEDPAVWILEGNNTVKVSNQAIDNLIYNLTAGELDSVTSETWSEKGQYYVAFHLAKDTIVYNFSSQKWAIYNSRIETSPGIYEDKAVRARGLVRAYGGVYCGDSQYGYIGAADLGVYQEYGETIKRVFSTQPFQNNQKPFSIPEVELTMESGVGDLVNDAQIMMEVSRDGGKTWEFPRPRGFGKQGEYSKRAVWRRLGRFDRFASFRFTLSDAVKPVALQLTADIVP